MRLRYGSRIRVSPGRTSGDIPSCVHKSIRLWPSWPSWWARRGLQSGHGKGESIVGEGDAGEGRRSAAEGTDVEEVRQLRAPLVPGRPTKEEIEDHSVCQWPFRCWCRCEAEPRAARAGRELNSTANIADLDIQRSRLIFASLCRLVMTTRLLGLIVGAC